MSDPSANIDPSSQLQFLAPTIRFDPAQTAAQYAPAMQTAPGQPAAPDAQVEALGGAQPVTLDAQAIAQRTSQLTKLYPTLKTDSGVLSALANLPVADDDLYGNVGRAATAAQATVQAAILTDLSDPAARYQRWQGYSKETQAAIEQTGFAAPAPPAQPKHGFFGSVLSDVEGLIKPSLQDVNQSHLITQGLGDVAGLAGQAYHDVTAPLIRDVAAPLGLGPAAQNFANLPSDVMQAPAHAYRALRFNTATGDTVGPNDPYSQTLAGALARGDWTAVSRAWEATAPGRPFYNESDVAKASRMLADNTDALSLAKATAAAGGDPAQGIQKMLGPQPATGIQQYTARANALLGISQGPHFAGAVQTLARAGTSPGRDSARSMGLQEGSRPYTLASGAGDAVFQWYSNPLNVAGRVTSAVRASRALTGDNLATAINAARFDESAGATTAGATTDGAAYWRRLGGLDLGLGGGVRGLVASKGSDAQAVADTAARQRYLVGLADHVNQRNADGWMAARPQDASAFQAFVDHANSTIRTPEMRGPDTQVTPNDILDWLDGGAGKAAIAKGQFASYLSPNDIELPRLSKTGAAAVWAKVKATPLGDQDGAVGLRPADVQPTQAGLVAKTAGNLLGTMANLPYQTSELLRVSRFDGKVVLTGPDALPSFQSYVRQYILPSPQRAQLINAFSDASTSQARRELVTQASETGMRQLGLDSTEAGQTFMQSKLSQMRESYDPAGRDVLPSGRKATLAPDLEEASAVQAPTLGELYKGAREAGVLGVVRNGLTLPQFETMVHRYWAPMALLRVGFVPRIVSEEFLTALMRLHPSQIAAGYTGTWLPRFARRMEAYSPLQASNPVSKLGGILASRALGTGAELAMQYFGPELGKAGAMMDEARGIIKDRTQASDLVGKLADRKAKLAKNLTADHPTVTGADTDLQAAITALRETSERAARNPIVQRAYGSIFGTGGGYAHATSITGDLHNVDGQYQPIQRIRMSGVYQNLGKGDMGDTDPAFPTAAAEYLAKFGRSPTLRAGLEAVRGYTDNRSMGPLRDAFAGTQAVTDAGRDNAALLRSLRAVYARAPEDVQNALRYYQRAVSTGAEGAQIDSGGILRRILDAAPFPADEGGRPDITPDVAELVDRVLGKGYKSVVPARETNDPQIASRIEAYKKSRSAKVRARLRTEIHALDPDFLKVHPPDGGPALDGEAIAALFAPPDAKVLTSREQAVTAAADAMARYMHSPAVADYLPHSDWIQDGLAQPLPKTHTRLYYPAADPGWSPSQVNLEDIVSPQMRADVAATVLNRRRLSGIVDGAQEGLNHQVIGLWGTTDPARAARVANHLAGDQAGVGYVDVPNELRDAQNYRNPTVDHVPPESPWLPYAKDAKTMTEGVAQRMGNLGGRLSGYLISEEQQALGTLLKDGHEVLADGNWANGRSLEDNIRRLAGKNADALADAFLGNGRFLHGPAEDLLRQDPKHVEFNLNHLKGVNVGDLPQTVPAAVEMHLSRPALDQRIVAKGFGRVIGPALESMVRSEAFTVNLMKGLRAAKIVEPHLVDQELRTLGQTAARTAGVSTSDLRHALDLRAEAKAKGYADLHPDSDEAALIARTGVDPDQLGRYSSMENRVDDHLNQIAAERATRDTAPYINNHQARSNFTEMARNVSPFLWAQESFLRRWSRALRYNPATFERLELGLHGLGSIGVIKKDQYGADAITIPGSGALTHLMGSIGLPYQLQASIPFTMEVKNLTPGFAHPATPAAGPLVTMPLAYLMGSQPEARLVGGNLGMPPSTKSGLGGALSELVPAGWARNLYAGLTNSADSQYWASARLQTMQMMAAAGHAPSPGATAAQMQTWEHQVSTWTRNVGLLRAVLGFFTPATPTLDPSHVKVLDGSVGGLHADLSAAMSTYGASDGVVHFMASHPDSGAYTVFGSQTAGDLAPPATKAAGEMLDANRGWFDAHPYAGAYFLPQAPDGFDKQTYADEVAAGMRSKKGTDILATEIVNSAASQTYYYYHDLYLQALAQAGSDSSARAQVQQGWGNWSGAFLHANPLFQEQLNLGTGDATRGNVIDDTRQAIASGDTPNPEAAKQIGGMLQLYDYWTQAHEALASVNTAAAVDQRKQIDATFQQVAGQYTATNPMAADFYTRIIVPEIASTDRALGRTLEVSAGG